MILPIYRDDDERAVVLPYCESLKQELAAQMYDGEPIRVRIDDRDIRGGEKKWQWVKRGVPLRVEVGPRDIAEGKVMFGRRDVAGKGQPTAARPSSSPPSAATLAAMQQSLFDAAQVGPRGGEREDRQPRGVRSLLHAQERGAARNPRRPGLLATSSIRRRWTRSSRRSKSPSAACRSTREDEPGKCIFTGQPSTKRGVFAKAY